MQSDLNDEFNSLGLCQFCTIQLLNQFGSSLQSRILDIQNSQLDLHSISIIDIVPIVCPCCLGLCQLANSDQFLNWICAQIKSSRFEVTCFSLNFKLPLTLKIRQRFILNHFMKAIDTYETLTHTDLLIECTHNLNKIQSPVHPSLTEFDLKQVIKNTLSQSISSSLNLTVVTTDDFIVTLEFLNPEDEEAIVR